MLTELAFYTIAKELASVQHIYLSTDSAMQPDYCLYLENQWDMGGLSGNMVNDDVSFIMPDHEPEFVSLFVLLAEVAPNMTVVQYRKLMSEVVNKSMNDSHNYYNSYSVTGYRKVYLFELYDFLVKNVW